MGLNTHVDNLWPVVSSQYDIFTFVYSNQVRKPFDFFFMWSVIIFLLIRGISNRMVSSWQMS